MSPQTCEVALRGTASMGHLGDQTMYNTYYIQYYEESLLQVYADKSARSLSRDIRTILYCAGELFQ